MRNRFAVTGLVLVALIIVFAVFAPLISSYSYEQIISVTDSSGKELIAKSLSPQIGGSAQNLFSDRTFLFGTDDMGRDLWTISAQSIGRKTSLCALNKRARDAFVVGSSVSRHCLYGCVTFLRDGAEGPVA